MEEQQRHTEKELVSIKSSEIGGGGKGFDRERLNLTKSKGLDKIMKYGGPPERYPSWRYKLEVFLGSEVPQYSGILKWVEGNEDPITEINLEK